MRNLKSIVAGYASKVQRSEVCCNSNGLMDRWINPPDDGPIPGCCADLSANPPFMTPTFDDLFTGEARSAEWVVPAITCPVQITITSTVSNTPIAGEILQIKLTVNGFPAIPAIPINGSATFTIQAGDEIRIEAQTNLLGAEYCHNMTFDFFNVTCGVNYPNVTQIFLNGTPDCIACPWDIPNIETSDREYLYGPYTNTTPGNITYDFLLVNVILSNFTNISVYYGSNPLYSNNPSIPIVSNGAPVTPQSVNLSPGQFIWIYAENFTNGNLSQYQIIGVINGDCGLIGNIAFTITLNK